MKKFFVWLLIILFVSFIIQDIYQSLVIFISIILLSEILINSNSRFVFREWALLLYAINYLIAPAITYRLPDEEVQYGMKLVSDQYFELALPGFLCLAIGMYIIPSKIFSIDLTDVNASSAVNETFLTRITIFGILLNVVGGIVAGELSFFIYLLSLVRFVGAFALFSMNNKKIQWVVIVLVIELINALLIGMFHDAIMWVVFFSLFYVYTQKPSIQVKLIGMNLPRICLSLPNWIRQ